MLVFIHAYEDFYCGLHGVEDMRVEDLDSMEQADEWGREMSYDVIESYGMDEHYFDEDAEEDAAKHLLALHLHSFLSFEMRIL